MEYKILDFPNPGQLEEKINEHAKDGWRVHSINLELGRALIEQEKLKASDFPIAPN